MIKELLGATLGLTGSILPELIKLFKTKQDHKHEIEIYKLQIEQAKILGNQKLEEISTSASLQADQMAYTYSPVVAPEMKSGFSNIVGVLIYAFNSLVRPIITYLFVGLYIWVKYAQFKVISLSANNVFEAIIKLWTDTDAGFVAMVIMFWFGGRQIMRSSGKLK